MIGVVALLVLSLLVVGVLLSSLRRLTGSLEDAALQDRFETWCRR